MSKKNKSNVAETPVSAVTVAPVNDAAAKLAELDASIAKMTAEREAAEKAIHEERLAKIAALPGEFGVATVEELIALIETLTNPPKPRKGNKRISDETKAQVVELSKGGMTGAAIAEKLGISLPSVHLIRKNAGLVNARKGVAAAA